MRFFVTYAIGVLFLTVLWTGDATAQTESTRLLEDRIDIAAKAWMKSYSKAEGEKQAARVATVDLAVPPVPALAALGISRETVIRPSSPREFTTGIVDGVDPNGNIQNGLTIQTNPYLLFGGNDLTLGSYREDGFQRFVSRIGLSLATAKGADDDESVRVGLGFSLTPFDRGDPRAAYEIEGREDPVTCIGETTSFVASSLSASVRDPAKLKNPALAEFNIAKIGKGTLEDVPSQDEVNSTVFRLLDEQREAIGSIGEVGSDEQKEIAQGIRLGSFEDCRTKFREESWNASSWTIGFAPTWISTDGSADNLDWSGAALYTTLSYGFEESMWPKSLRDNSQVLLHARYRSDEIEADSTAASGFIEQDTLTLAGQVRVGIEMPSMSRVAGADTNFLGEVAYIRSDRNDGMLEESMRYSVGVQFKVDKGLYLNVTGGTEDSEMDENDQVFVGLSVSWNFSDDPVNLPSLFK
jgi:hypothetical protein